MPLSLRRSCIISALHYNSQIKFSAEKFACAMHLICANVLIEMLRTCLFTGGLLALHTYVHILLAAWWLAAAGFKSGVQCMFFLRLLRWCLAKLYNMTPVRCWVKASTDAFDIHGVLCQNARYIISGPGSRLTVLIGWPIASYSDIFSIWHSKLSVLHIGNELAGEHVT